MLDLNVEEYGFRIVLIDIRVLEDSFVPPKEEYGIYGPLLNTNMLVWSFLLNYFSLWANHAP